MNRRMRNIQLAGDALIPLLGFFWWNWSLYFIILFYLADMIIGEVVVHLKSKRIGTYNQIKTAPFVFALGSTFLMLVSIFLVHIAMEKVQPDINFLSEMVAFWNYEDMGIQQGYLLLPLLIFIAYQRYKMEFLMPARYRTMDQVRLWKKHISSYLVLISGTGLVTGMTVFFPLPEVFLLFGIITSISLYQLLVTD